MQIRQSQTWKRISKSTKITPKFDQTPKINPRILNETTKLIKIIIRDKENTRTTKHKILENI